MSVGRPSRTDVTIYADGRCRFPAHLFPEGRVFLQYYPPRTLVARPARIGDGSVRKHVRPTTQGPQVRLNGLLSNMGISPRCVAGTYRPKVCGELVMVKLRTGRARA